MRAIIASFFTIIRNKRRLNFTFGVASLQQCFGCCTNWISNWYLSNHSLMQSASSNYFLHEEKRKKKIHVRPAENSSSLSLEGKGKI